MSWIIWMNALLGVGIGSAYALDGSMIATFWFFAAGLSTGLALAVPREKVPR